MASTSSTKLLAAYLVVLFMVFAAAKAQVETCPSTLLDDLKNTCSDAATNASVAPSAACCGVVGSASTSCLCNALIEWGTGKVDMNATLAIPKTCAVYVKAGSTCAGLPIPAYPAEQAPSPSPVPTTGSEDHVPVPVPTASGR